MVLLRSKFTIVLQRTKTPRKYSGIHHIVKQWYIFTTLAPWSHCGFTGAILSWSIDQSCNQSIFIQKISSFKYAWHIDNLIALTILYKWQFIKFYKHIFMKRIFRFPKRTLKLGLRYMAQLSRVQNTSNNENNIK